MREPAAGLDRSGGTVTGAAPAAPVPVCSAGSMVIVQSANQVEAARLIGGLALSLTASAMANESLPRIEASLPVLPAGLVVVSGTGNDGVSVASTV